MCFAMVESVKVVSLWHFGRRIRATLAKVKIDGSLDAGSFKNEMPPLEFELGEKSPSSTCKFTRKS